MHSFVFITKITIPNAPIRTFSVSVVSFKLDHLFGKELWKVKCAFYFPVCCVLIKWMLCV